MKNRIIMKSVGKYKIIKELGAGGFGAVYLAQDPKLNELVAIKVFQIKDDNLARLATSATSDANEVLNQRFLNEARTLRQLGKNPHIVNVFDFDELDDGRPYYVMPYLPKSLKDELGSDATDISVISELPSDEKPKRLPVTQALTYLAQLLNALSDVHKAGLVHRDIKPANLLLNEDNEVQLCDFGIAKMPDVQHSQSGIGMGSRNYMAPEQRQSAKHVDARSDIYSVGVLAYRMITGTLPEGRFAEPNTFQPNLSAALNDVILKALAQQKENRFQDAAQMLKALKQAQQSQTNTQANQDGEETGTWVGGEAESITIKAELKPLEAKIIELLQKQGEVRASDNVYLQALADIADLSETGLTDLISQVSEQQQKISNEQKALIQWTTGINKRLTSNQGQLDDTYIASAVSAGASTTGKTEQQLQQLLTEKSNEKSSENNSKQSENNADTELAIIAPIRQTQNQNQQPAEVNNQPRALPKVALIFILLLLLAGGGYYGFDYYQTEQLKEQARLAQLSQAEQRTEQVSQVQQLLIQLNYQISKTGKLDKRTQKAIEQFEQSQKLIVTGEIDEILLTNLNRAYDNKNIIAWSKAKKLNSSESYQQYIDNFPYALNLTTAQKAKHEALTQERIAKEKAKIKKDNAAWAKAKKMNTSKSYQQYIDDFPFALNVTAANKAKEEAKKQEQISADKAKTKATRRADDLAWKKASNQNSVAVYQAYLSTQKLGRYRTKANAAIAAIKLENRKLAITITTNPSDTNITLLNIKESYYKGVRLLPGDYQIKISKAGYHSQSHTITISKNNQQFNYLLTMTEAAKAAKAVKMSDNGRYQYLNKGQVVLDTSSKLQWMRCSLGQTLKGSRCTGTPQVHSWGRAKKKGSNITYAGYSDWRIPSNKELHTLVMCTSNKPARYPINGRKCKGVYSKPTIFSLAFPDTPGEFWSSAAFSFFSGSAWGVDFYVGGDSGSKYRNLGKYVRLVRGGQ
ncbi:MAG: protein kinase [Reichenbachiella sp.]